MSLHLCQRAGLLYRRDPAFMLELGRAGRPLVRGGLPGRPVLFLHDPATIDALLTRHHAALAKGAAHNRARTWLGDSVLVAEGAEHARLRRAARPAFRRELLAGYAPLVAAAAKRQIAGWRHGERRDVVAEMGRLATSVVLAVFAGSADLRAAAEVDAALAVLTPAFGARRWPWSGPAARLGLGGAARQAAALARLDATIYALVDAGLERGATALLASVAESEPPARRRAAARDALATLLLAGRETVAAALSWAWHALAASPEVEAALHAALAATPQAAGPPATAGRIVAETLRLYPPAWATARRALTPLEVAGAAVPAGAVLLFSQLALHRDGRWFAEPERFAPERWAGAAPPQAAYLPFGAGPRRCIGAGFAAMELSLILSLIARRWRLRPAEGHPVRLRGGPALMPLGGLPMRLEARDT